MTAESRFARLALVAYRAPSSDALQPDFDERLEQAALEFEAELTTWDECQGGQAEPVRSPRPLGRLE